MQKEQISQEVEKISAELLKLSHQIHDNPELGGEERQAVLWQKELLEQEGFSFETPFCGMDTAYKAVFKGEGTGPTIAFLAEYDALAGLGHGCGHNLIAAGSVGAAIALAKTLGKAAPEIRLYGTPAEETWGGKIPMVEQGAFSDVDFAMMFHPAVENIIGRPSRACVGVDAVFHGKSAHSAAPETGINALTALVGLFTRMFTMTKEGWPEGNRANGIITEGGNASNVITDTAKANFTLRAWTLKDLEIIIADFKRMAKEAADEIGATAELSFEAPFAERYPNRTMGQIFAANMKPLGEIMNLPAPDAMTGSSDIGNVSLVVPTIHEYLKIAEPGINGHSVEYREAAASERADQVVLLAAKGLAMTGYDLITNQELRDNARKEFEETVPAEYRK